MWGTAMNNLEVDVIQHSQIAWHCFNADKFVKGCYAVSVTGELPQDVIDSLQDKGIPYRSRDNSNR